VAKSSVAMSSVFPTGTPHEEQKRTLADNSEPQDKHLGMKISRYRINQAAGVGRQASEVRLQTSDLRPQTSDLRPQTSDLRPQTSDLRPQTYFPCIVEPGPKADAGRLTPHLYYHPYR
jgi:hypothetical protein